MSRSRRFSTALPIVSAFLLGLPAIAAAQPHLGYSPHFCQIWNTFPSANLQSGDSVLGAVTAISASNQWAVGNSFDGTHRHTLAEHGNGGGWAIVATPDGSQPNSFLLAVDAKGAGNVWAVGFSASENPFDPQSTTLVESWSGTSWGIVDSPNPTMPGGGESTNELYGVGVAGPNDVWVVGKTADFTTSQSLILHWDGLEWTDFSTPDNGDGGWLTAIEVVAPDDIWAVGFDIVDFIQVNLIKHWDGQHWTNVDAPNVGPFVNQLQSVSATSKDDVWAVGYHLAVFGVDQVNQTSILHWNGTAWSVVDSPNRSERNNYLFGVVGQAAGRAWAVGFWDNGVQLLTLIEHWDGLTWNVILASPNASDAINELTGVVSVGPDEAWAVGQEFGAFNWETFVAHLACPGMVETRTVTR
ncbi:MAG TPA: hypothetical protein VGH97_17960 [Thermoanaerobaculia bacterium]|jgi:hypothetical protein